MSEVLFQPCSTCEKPVGCRIARACMKNVVKKEAADAPKKEEAGQPAVLAAGPAQEAPVLDEASKQKALAAFAESRLCRKCRYAVKPALGPWGLASCVHPSLPVNYVTGEKVFPCVIARGYNELCGALGLKWQVK